MAMQRWEKIGSVANFFGEEGIIYIAKATLVLGGAAIGAAIGSSFGPLGTAVGTVVGAFVGALAAAMLDKLTGMDISLDLSGIVKVRANMTYA